jgi:hypothetical protein
VIKGVPVVRENYDAERIEIAFNRSPASSRWLMPLSSATRVSSEYLQRLGEGG